MQNVYKLLVYKCTQNRFTVQVYTKPAYYVYTCTQTSLLYTKPFTYLNLNLIWINANLNQVLSVKLGKKASQTTHEADIFKTLNFCISMLTHLKKEKFHQIYVNPVPQVLRFQKTVLDYQNREKFMATTAKWKFYLNSKCHQVWKLEVFILKNMPYILSYSDDQVLES